MSAQGLYQIVPIIWDKVSANILDTYLLFHLLFHLFFFLIFLIQELISIVLNPSCNIIHMIAGLGNNLSLHIFCNLANRMEAETEVVININYIFELPFKKVLQP